MAATATVHHWPHSMSSPPALSAERVESRLKGLALLKGVRVSEFFKDFDPLRSGKITKAQFRRCLDQHLGLPVSDNDYLSLAGKYESTGPGDAGILVNYRQFCETMESSFNPDITDGNPEQQIDAFHKSAYKDRPNIAPEILQRTDELLQQCSVYYTSRGINIKTCYRDFDRHCRGFVTQSQFHRSFPGPPEVSEADIALLADRYRDPSNGLYNYLTFHHDVCRMSQDQSTTGSKQQTGLTVPKSPADTLDDVFKRIRDVVYRYGIRTTEFFRDHDKLRSGMITVNQFVCGLSLCVGQRANLTRDEVAMVTRHYQTNDGRVRYKEFCDLMENAYNEPGLEKRPTANVTRPLRGHLHKSLNSMSDEDEEQLDLALLQIRREVSKRQLLLYPYFRDFDRGKGFTRGVTKPQFERLLHFLSIKVTPQDLKLIENKFSDPVSGDVNYSSFIQAVDEHYTGQVMEQPHSHTTSTPSQAPPTPTSAVRVDVDELMERIRQYVLTNRVRVCEHFQDFDNLRCGSIKETRFRQGLNGLGQTTITSDQFRALCHRYADPDHANQILWRAFTYDIDTVFECMGESPSTSTKPALLPVGAVDFAATTTDDQQTVLRTALDRLGQRVTQRRLLLSPCFRDFDKLNSGYVTSSQFMQCLAYLDLSVTPDEQAVILMRFGSAKGVNYLQFLRELQGDTAVEDKYQQRLGRLLALNTDMAPCPPPPLTARSVIADDVMNTIKTRVSKERMRVLEFMIDYDKLRSGKISVTSFRRALDLCGFSLTNDELYCLVERYGSTKDPSFVNYVKFSDDVEEIFTVKELEKTPTAVVKQFVPAQLVDCISPEENQLLQKCMHRLAERVRVRRIQLLPLFEDYDKVHIGSVTKGQFHRVLSELELGGMISQMEFAIIYRQFGVRVGGRTDVNYSFFCALIDEYAMTRWTDPALK